MHMRTFFNFQGNVCGLVYPAKIFFRCCCNGPICFQEGGITCEAIDEPGISSKVIDKRVIINFRDKNVAIARIATKMRFYFNYFNVDIYSIYLYICIFSYLYILFFLGKCLVYCCSGYNAFIYIMVLLRNSVI